MTKYPTDYAFLHGGGQGSWVWEDTIDALGRQTADGFGRALALDAPGCGAKRGRAGEDLGIEDIARELIADIECAGLKEVVLVGHSQAGNAIPAMIRMRPGLFQRIVYVSCSIPSPGQSVREMVGSGRQGSNQNEVGFPFDPSESLDTNERYSLMFCNDMTAQQRSSFLAKLGKDRWPERTYTETQWSYDGLDVVPATFVICLKDAILPVPWQETFARRFGAERRVLIDAGHQVMNTRPHSLAEALRYEGIQNGRL